ncbi:MerR family transcriptional regulator [Dictyobacter arantiisoli]|uniref:MerR family transcriptional regulator n=1 Tax=Dictyobacter arantiisoli TaxID=2014874 RepID=UPI001C0F1A44|nr:MerR family transcriptional regulator [Dictyobacter arantiisoli]
MVSDTEMKMPLHFTLQEVVQRSSLSEHTLPYYERIGLLDRVRQDRNSGHRRYSAEDVRNIETLTCLRTTGMSIEDMRTYFALLKDGKAAADQQLALFEGQKKAMEQNLAQKQELCATWSRRSRSGKQSRVTTTQRRVKLVRSRLAWQSS